MIVPMAFVMLTFFAGIKIGQEEAAAVEVTCFCDTDEYEREIPEEKRCE